ncbi:Hsp20/alpha crystallin family protein [Aphelenchoides avenae]|nr:Hsp20/alpha crystallin family protein [Aphelenchus avenae]
MSSSKFYEQSEHYVREYELKNGLGREMIEQESRTRGQPFQSSFGDRPFASWDREPFRRPPEFTEFPSKRSEWESKYRPSGPRIVPTYTATPATVGERRPYASDPLYTPVKPPRATEGYYATSQPYGGSQSTHIPATHPYHVTNYYCYPPVEPYGPTGGRYSVPPPPGVPVNGPYREPLFPHHHHHHHSEYAHAKHPSTITPTDPQRSTSRGPSTVPPECKHYSSRPGSPQPVAGAGDIINTENGFTIQLDVKHFEPKDIKAGVSLSGNTLTVTGERTEEDPSSEQTLKRSFSRKYAIPDDIKLESVKSYMTDNGQLVIKGIRKQWKETEISVQVDTEASKAETKSASASPGSSKSSDTAKHTP